MVLPNPTAGAALLIATADAQNSATDTPRRRARRAERENARSITPDPLLNAKESAAEAGVALSTWWKWVKLGRFPAPHYPLPRCPRWRRSEVRAAALDGAAGA